MAHNMTIAQFIAHLAAFPLHLHHQTEKALEKAAELVEKEAKAEIGTYQGAAGPFAAWEELADATKDDRSKQGFPENEPLLRTGEMRDSIEHKVDGWAGEAAVGSDDDKAVWQELGTDKIPPRSFLGGAAFRKGPEVAKILGSSVVQALIGKSVFGGSLPIP